MELVVEEKRRPRKWYFSDGEYICLEKNEVCAKVHGDKLPDPDKLRLERLKIQKTLEPNERANYRVEPDPVVIALFEHWRNNA